MTYPRRMAPLSRGQGLADEQRQALKILADCFADDGIVDDAQNIRAALDCLQSLEMRADEAEAEAEALRTRLDEAERRTRIAEAAAIKEGWKGRAESAEARIERLAQERNEARAAAQAVLVSLKAQGQVADTAEASATALRERVEHLEAALREAEQVMRECASLLMSPDRGGDLPHPDIIVSAPTPEAD